MIQFNLSKPIPFFNTFIVKGAFRLNYPEGLCYWQLLNEEGQKLIDGNITFPSDLLQNHWTTSDEPLITYLIEQSPWEPRSNTSANVSDDQLSGTPEIE